MFHLLIENKFPIAFLALYSCILCMDPLMSFDQSGIPVRVLTTRVFADKKFAGMYFLVRGQVRFSLEVPITSVCLAIPAFVLHVFQHMKI